MRDVLDAGTWWALIDPRVRKRAVPERLRGMAPLTIGLGPNFVAGETVDLAIESTYAERDLNRFRRPPRECG
jgi:xanthine dehydrogenase accessory factor